MERRAICRISELLIPGEVLLDLVELFRPVEPEACTPDGGVAAAISSGRAPARRPSERWLLIVTNHRVGTALSCRRSRSAARWAPVAEVTRATMRANAACGSLIALQFTDGSRFLAHAVRSDALWSDAFLSRVAANRISETRPRAVAS
jgi:hypothetical protein